MRIFVTGGTGFIGTYVLQRALAEGHEVVALRRSTTSHTVVPLEQQPLWMNRNLNDLRPDDLHGCDVVIHLASIGVSPKKASWRELIYVNVLGSAHLVETAHQAGVDRLVVAGSCHEYGEFANHCDAIPVNAPLEPLTPYGASKASAYHLIATQARCLGLYMYYGRIFNVYGEGQYYENFWPSLCRAALSGKDFPMTSGKQVRDFTPVETVARKLLHAATDSKITPGIPCVKNIGTGKPTTLLDFAKSEWLRLNATGRLQPGLLPDRPNEAQHLYPELD